MKGVLLCAGLGKRLRPLTLTTPKPLIPVAGVPAIVHGIETLKSAGVEDLIVVVNPKNREVFEEVLGDGSDYGVRLEYTVQEKQLGLAHALKTAEDLLDGESFVMYLGDNLILEDISDFVKGLEDSEAVVAVKSVSDPRRFGVVSLEGDRIVGLVEKPENPPSDLAIVGLYAFKPSIFEAIDRIKPSWRGEYEITDAIAELVADGRKVKAYRIKGWWKDIGKFSDLIEANSKMMELKRSWISSGKLVGSELKGNVEIGVGSEIRNSKIFGPVVVGKNVVVEDSILGPNLTVGDGCILKGVELRDSILMEGCRIENSKLEGSVLGREVVVENVGSNLKAILGDFNVLKGI